MGDPVRLKHGVQAEAYVEHRPKEGPVVVVEVRDGGQRYGLAKRIGDCEGWRGFRRVMELIHVMGDSWQRTLELRKDVEKRKRYDERRRMMLGVRDG